MKRMILAAMLVFAGLPTAPASDQMPLKSFERGSWPQLLHSHAGHLTIVHFWGVTCGPCKVELPQLGDFMKQHPKVEIVTISADLVPNLGAAARSMLQSAGLSSAENWIFSDGYAERLRYEVDPSWQGDIPRTMLIAREGEITTIEGSADMAALQKRSRDQGCAA